MTVAALDVLRGRQWAVVVTVAGLTDRYYSGPHPDSQNIPGTGGALTYRDIEAVLSLGPESCSVDEVDATVEQSPVSVRLLARGAALSPLHATTTARTVDPLSTLRRIGPRGATSRTTLGATLISEAGPSVITCTSDISAWTGLIHCGLEALHVAGAGTGSALDLDVARGVAYTRIARHVWQPSRGYQPAVTREVTAWRGRVCIVQAAPVANGVRVGSYAEVWRGVLDREPSLAADGLTLELRIAPLSALLRQRLSSGATSTTLVRGWHYIVPGQGSRVTHDQIFERSEAYQSQYKVHGGTDAEVDIRCYRAHERLTDITLDPDHPRGGQIEVDTGGVSTTHAVTARALGGGGGRLTTDPSPAAPAGGAPFGLVVSPYVEEPCTLELVDPTGTGELVRWPERALQVIAGTYASAVTWNDTRHDCDRWRIATTQGRLGRWARVELAGDGAGWLWRAGLIVGGAARAPLSLRWTPGLDVCVGVDFRAPDDARKLYDLEAQSIAIRRERVSADADLRALARIPCRGPALAWYQGSERRLLVADDVYSGAGQPQMMRLSGGDESNDARGHVDVIVTASSAVNDPDTGDLVGYLLTVSWVDDDRRYILDRGTPITVTPQARSQGVDPGILLLRLLQSGGGGQVHGAYDVLPYGAGLDDDDMLEDSFSALPMPEPLRGVSADVSGSSTVADVMGGVLTLIGAAVVQRWADGRQRLVCTPIGPAPSADAVMVITDADILADGQCVSTVDGRVVRSYRIESDHDAAGEPGRVTTYVDSDAVDATGGDAGEQMTLDLRHIRLDGGGADAAVLLLPVIQHLRRRAGVPRVRYQVAVSADHVGALEVGVGDTVTLTCSSAVGIDGTLGLTSEPCRVLGVERDWLGNRVQLTLGAAGLRPSGWAPSLRVASVSSPTVVVVSANQYTSAVCPRTGEAQTDIGRTSLAYFAVGDKVRCIPAGAWASGGEVTITVIAGNTVTFGAAHGLAAGDDIDHADYDDASAAARVYAYLSDAAHTLGTAAARGRDVG
jgi:hypothetical protein